MNNPIQKPSLLEKNQIKANQAVFIHELAPSSQVGGTLLSILVMFAFWNAVDTRILLIWFFSTSFISALRLLHWQRAKSFIQDEKFMLSWLPKLQFLLFLSGFFWGLGAWFLYLPDDLFHSTLLLLFLMGIISGGIGALSPQLPCYIIYSMSAGIPFSIKLFIEHESTSIIMPIALLLYLVVNTAYARNIQNNIIKIIVLRFENKDLVEQLTKKNQEAKKQTKFAESANLSKSQFLAAASHDLAQPLHSLTLFLSALKEDKDPEKQAEYLKKAELCAASMNELFSVLMDISRLDAGVIDANLQTYSSNDLIKPIAHEFELKAQEENLNFDIEIQNYLIETDGIIFQRIIRNLLSNAIKHNKNCTIGIKTQSIKDSLLQIDIHDDGVGIPKDELDNIFKEFYQLNNPERDKQKGLGLGLAIVKRLAQLINADVSVSSSEDKGTCFSITIPAIRKIEHATHAHSVVSESDLSNFVILLIDDDKLILDATEAAIKSWGSKIVCSESETEALRKLITLDIIPHIIISDYRLRENHTGIEAIQNIREEFNIDIPAIIITGETSAEVAEAVKSYKAKLIHKPVDNAELKRIVSKLLLV